MSRAPSASAFERLGAGDIDRFIDDCARRERARRADLQRKAGAAAGGVFAAFLAAASAEAREDNSFAQPDANVSPDGYRVASAEDMFSFAEICAAESEGSIFAHAAHAARSLAAATFEDGFVSRLASRFDSGHAGDHQDGDHAASAYGGHAAGASHAAPQAHASHTDDTVAASGHDHGGSEDGASEARAAHSSHQRGDVSLAAGAPADGHGDHGADNAGSAASIDDDSGVATLPAGSESGGIVADADLTEALDAFLGAAETAPEAPAPAAAPVAEALPANDHAHATLAESAPAEILVAPLAEI